MRALLIAACLATAALPLDKVFRLFSLL